MALHKEDFEDALLEAHNKYLKDGYDAIAFTDHVLDEMYCADRDGYFDEHGNESYYEIPAREASSKTPFVVS